MLYNTLMPVYLCIYKYSTINLCMVSNVKTSLYTIVLTHIDYGQVYISKERVLTFSCLL